MSTRIVLDCGYCGATFSVKRCDHRPHFRQCCSVPCVRAYKLTVEFRFWRRVDKNGPVPGHCKELGRCWPWVGFRRKDAGFEYGIMARCDGTGRQVRAHRFSWELHNGPVPDGLMVMHKCDNPPCVNPAHLAVGTCLDNVRDMDSKDRRISSSLCGSEKPQSKLTEDDVAKIRGLYATGTHQSTLSARYGVSQATVSAIVLGKTWRHVGGPVGHVTPIQPVRRGEDNFKSKLTESDVRRMRYLSANGAGFSELSEMFSVSMASVRRIVRGDGWSHVK